MLKELYKKYFLNYYKLIIKIFCVILIGTISFLLVFSYSHKKKVSDNPRSDISIVEDDKIEEQTAEEVEEDYYVDIKGAIANPNVYKVKKDSRIIDVIGLAGGLTNDADTSTLNLSKKVTDEMFIIIYTKSEIEKFKKNGTTTTEVIKYVEKECKCPDPIINDACINNGKEENTDSTNKTNKISLNTATKEDLMTLPGIGESKALAIIEYKNNNGLFKNIEDIKNVTGIGDSVFDKIKNLIAL
jgi:competence protein ComEA